MFYQETVRVQINRGCGAATKAALIVGLNKMRLTHPLFRITHGWDAANRCLWLGLATKPQSLANLPLLVDTCGALNHADLSIKLTVQDSLGRIADHCSTQKVRRGGLLPAGLTNVRTCEPEGVGQIH